MAQPTEDPASVARLLGKRVAEGPLDLPVSGSSMVGVIDAGSTVRITAADRPRRGEIWAFVNDGGRITVHRIRELDETSVTGRGTGNPADDPPVGRDRLIGRVRESFGAGGRIHRFGELDRIFAAGTFSIRRALRPLFRRVRT